MRLNVLRPFAVRRLIPAMPYLRRATVLLVVSFVACLDSTGPSPSGVRRLMNSENAVCALDATGGVFCWGINGAFFEFGESPNAHGGSVTPFPANVQKLKWLGGGVGTHLCGITEERDAICWGRGTFGQLGRGTLGDTGNVAGKVSGPHAWADISVGRITTCGLTEDGDAYCWGANQLGEVGDSTVPLVERSTTPRPVVGGHKFKVLVAGWLHACGITTANVTLCWGANGHGQLGIGTTDTLSHRFPVEVSGGHTFKQLALGSRYTCGITTSDAAYCWGANAKGQLGDGTTATRALPESVQTPMKFTRIVAGSGFATSSNVLPQVGQGEAGHTCALTATGKAFCWGWNADGQLGDLTTQDKLTPVPVSSGETFETLGLSSANSCGMRGNAVWCWGSNLRGHIGRNTNGLSVVNPFLVPAPFNKP